MKAKFIIAAIFILSFAKNSYAQDYIPMLNNSSWMLIRTANWEPVYRMMHEGTPVVIGGETFLQFEDPFPVYVDSEPVPTVYVREDVVAHKVYRIHDGVENMIYDFNLQTGDVISQYGYTFTATADQIDVNGSMRKRITLKTDHVYLGHYVLTQVWIEGVGSEADSLFPERNMFNVASASGGVKYKTYCSFQNGAHIYGEADCPELQITLSTENQAYQAQKIIFAPNPMLTELTISSTLALQNATLKLYNLQGQLIREMNHLDGEKIMVSRGNLASGMYFAQLSEDGKPIKTSKITVD